MPSRLRLRGIETEEYSGKTTGRLLGPILPRVTDQATVPACVFFCRALPCVSPARHNGESSARNR